MKKREAEAKIAWPRRRAKLALVPNAPGSSSIFLSNYSTPPQPLSSIVNSSLGNGGNSKIFDWNWLSRTRNQGNGIGFDYLCCLKDRRGDAMATALLHRDLDPTKIQKNLDEEFIYFFCFLFFFNCKFVVL